MIVSVEIKSLAFAQDRFCSARNIRQVALYNSFSVFLSAIQLEESLVPEIILLSFFLTKSPFEAHTLEVIDDFSINRNAWFWWSSDIVTVIIAEEEASGGGTNLGRKIDLNSTKSFAVNSLPAIFNDEGEIRGEIGREEIREFGIDEIPHTLWDHFVEDGTDEHGQGGDGGVGGEESGHGRNFFEQRGHWLRQRREDKVKKREALVLCFLEL